MNFSVIQLINLGRKYLSLWPQKPELTQYFEEYWAVQSARFICNYFPGLALFTFIIQLYVGSGLFGGQGSVSQVINALPQALVYTIFLLSMPVQALVFSGVKADKHLPPSLASWYQSGLQQVKKQKEQVKSPQYQATVASLATHKPRYIDLAQLLQLTFEQK